MTASPEAAYRRLRRLANLALFAVDLQCARLNRAEPEDEEFVFRKWYDFEFLLIALVRLRRLVKQASRLPGANSDSLIAALERFDAALPGLTVMRNVSEHVDEYSVDQGRDRNVQKEMLETSQLGSEGPRLTWLGAEIDASEALAASRELFRVLQEAGRHHE